MRTAADIRRLNSFAVVRSIHAGGGVSRRELVDLTGSTAADHRIVITQLIDNPGDSGGYVAFRFVPNRADQGSTVLS